MHPQENTRKHELYETSIESHWNKIYQERKITKLDGKESLANQGRITKNIIAEELNFTLEMAKSKIYQFIVGGQI